MLLGWIAPLIGEEPDIPTSTDRENSFGCLEWPPSATMLELIY